VMNLGLGRPDSAPVPAGTLAELERTYITETLRRTNWVVGGQRGAAAQLGLPRTTLIARMRKHGIARDTGGFTGVTPLTAASIGAG